MKKVVILQPYNCPYRNPLFDEIAGLPDILLYIVYFGSREESRKWKYNYGPKFKEIQLAISIKKTGFESNAYTYSLTNIIKVLFSIKPDVIIGLPNKIGKIMGLLRPFFGYKLISWTEDTMVTTNGRKYGFKHKLSYFNKVKSFIVPGKLAQEHLVYAGIKVKNSDVFFAPNTIDDIQFYFDEDAVKSKFSNLTHLNFLFAGHLSERKGIDLLFKAINALNQRKYRYSYHFDFVGEIILRDDNLTNVQFHGFKDGDDYVNFFKTSHVLILPSRQDCNPLVVIEALKAGLIILVSKGVGSYPEFTAGNGISFEANSTNSIIEAIEKILTSELAELCKMSATSYQYGKDVTAKNSADAFHKAIMHATTT